MRRRGLIASLVGIIAVAAFALGATLVAGRAPLLGLDLRGGVSLVLAPQGKVTPSILQQAVRIIDRRVNGLGVANSTVARQGNDVVIELPGIRNSQQALAVLGTTAQLYFRPVYCTIPGYSPPATAKLSGAKAAAAKAAAAKAAATPVSSKLCTASNASAVPSTTPDKDVASNSVVLPSSPNMGSSVAGERWVLGPANFTGQVVASASAGLPQGSSNYAVNVTLTSSGLAKFNKVAAVRHAFYNPSATSQSFQSLEAIELDGVVESAPTIQSAVFSGPVQITGQFTATQANHLALELNYGSLPVRFNPQSVQNVSATIGGASLRAGLLAGLGGIVLVLLYMLVYYRALGLVVLLGLGVGGALLYSILTELSYTSSLALTLAGITGIIVSVGITVDSYVVYFERLKDEVRSGKTIRFSVERGFTRAFRTVLTADLVSFMAALILYIFTVGSVRGFAFTLGLSTLLDVVTAYLFIRPIVILLGRRRSVTRGGALGIASGLGVRQMAGTSS